MNTKEIYIERVTSMHQRHEDVQRRLARAFNKHELFMLTHDVDLNLTTVCPPTFAKTLWEVGLRSTRTYARDLGLQDKSWQDDLRKLNTGELPKANETNINMCPDCGAMMLREKFYRVCRSQYHSPVIRWNQEVN